MSRLADTLARLAEKRVRGEFASAPARPQGVTPAATEPVGVDSFLPGGVLEGPRGRCYLHERLRSEIEKPVRTWGQYRAPRGTDLHPELETRAQKGAAGTVFLDLETCGLSSAPVFLAGTMHWNGSDFVVRQYFARDYGEEAALVDELVRFLAGFDTVITYNGKSFDLPFLGDRAAMHHVPFVRPAAHLDLVHHARRLWGTTLPNCRLVTIEQHVCRRKRVGDVPGSEVPELYHDFVKHGAPHRLIPVFHHNLLDVITMDEILRALIARAGEDDGLERVEAWELE